MTLEPIIARIKSDAESSARGIIDDARLKVSELLSAANASLEKDAAAAEEGIIAQERDIRDRLLRMAELDLRKELLTMKREALSAAFDNAAKRLLAMNESDAKAFITRAVVASAQGGETLTPVGVSRAWLNRDCVNEINRKLAEKGVTTGVTLKSGDAADAAYDATTGGCILKRGGMSMPLTYDAILAGIRGRLESEVAYALFGGEQ